MTVEARRKASAKYHAKREAAGLKKVTLWLSPEARFKLDALKKAAGSKDKAAEAAIMAWAGVVHEAAKAPPAAKKPAKAKASTAEPTKAPAVKAAIATGLQLGPTPTKFGSRLKVKK